MSSNEEVFQIALDCQRLLKEYLACVNGKRGLSHVDDCSDEGIAYKQCVKLETTLRRAVIRNEMQENASQTKN